MTKLTSKKDINILALLLTITYTISYITRINYGAVILEMERAGADLIEIGIPFSDPTAEGVVIQNANIRALNGGMTTDKVFEIVRKVREKSHIPLVFLTYINPVYKYGYYNFFEACREVGIDGIIVPDVPFEEKHEIEDVANKYGIDIISLIAQVFHPQSNSFRQKFTTLIPQDNFGSKSRKK